MQTLNQGQEFLCYYIIGIIICFVFDIFRSSRYIFKPSDIVTYIEDVIFIIFCAIIIITAILYISSGVLRFYIILAIGLGILTYSLTISKLCVIIFTNIFKLLEKYLWQTFSNLKYINY